MTAQGTIRGGIPVRALAELPAAERWVIGALRDWCDGTDGQARVWRDLARGLGTVRGRAAMSSFETVLSILLCEGRRRVCRHACGCPCAGLDEALVAHFVSLAARGAEEDALLMAMLLVPADRMWPLVSAAQQVGLAVQMMLGDTPGATCPDTPESDGEPTDWPWLGIATRH